MRKSIAAAVVAASVAISACGQIDGDSGQTVSRNYQVGDFQQIKVGGPYEVTVRTGANPGVTARGSENLLDRTDVEVKDGTLLIHGKRSHGLSWGWSSHGKADFTVTVPQLTGATIGGSGDIHVDHVRGDRFKGSVAGSGGLNVDTVEVGALDLSIAGSGSAKAAAGKAKTASYDIGGSGDIDAVGVKADQAKVSIAGSGSVKANASGTADVRIMGSGDVDVSGGAKCSISKSGSGDVRCS
jgi:hypothetical protein